MRQVARIRQRTLTSVTPHQAASNIITQNIPKGTKPEPPIPTPVDPTIIGVLIDNYAGGFARLYWNPAAHPEDLYDGELHYFKMLLALTPGPGGAIYEDTAALAANGGILWFDNNGTLGKTYYQQQGQPPHEVTVVQAASAIDAEKILTVYPEGDNLIIVGIS